MVDIRAGRREESYQTAHTLLEHPDLPLLIRARACMVLGCAENREAITWAEQGVRIAELGVRLVIEAGGVPGRIETGLVDDCKDVLKQAQEWEKYMEENEGGGEEVQEEEEEEEEEEEGGEDEEREGAEADKAEEARKDDDE